MDRNRILQRHYQPFVGRPFTGAWIETSSAPRLPMTAWSPLHGGVDRNAMRSAPASRSHGRPFTGAWIETPCQAQALTDPDVAPSRGRGSKHGDAAAGDGRRTSPLHGGVDRNASKIFRAAPVAGRPFTGAWIETPATRTSRSNASSPLHGGVDRNARFVPVFVLTTVAPSRGRGSKPGPARR